MLSARPTHAPRQSPEGTAVPNGRARPTVAIVIVNYRTPELVIDCLESLRSESIPGFNVHVYVGDARSDDGSLEKIRTHLAQSDPANVTCVDIGANGGFAYGNNYLLTQHVLEDPHVRYVHFLNPNTYIHPEAVRSLVTFLEAHPRAAIAGSRLENSDGSPRAFAFRFPSPVREFFSGANLGLLDRLVPSCRVAMGTDIAAQRVDWVSGASFMARRSVLDDVGLMDDRYFLYFEEVDLMSRVSARGHEVWHLPQSRVVHLAGQASGFRTGGPPRRLPEYWYHSRFRFLRKRYGLPAAVAANLLFMTGRLLGRCARILTLRRASDTPHILTDMIRHGFSSDGTHGPAGKDRGAAPDG